MIDTIPQESRRGKPGRKKDSGTYRATLDAEVDIQGISLCNNDNELLIKAMPAFMFSPEKFAKFIFPWKEEGTPLVHESGPDGWQLETLADLGRMSKEAIEGGPAALYAVASGHGIGKSALMAWIILWFLSTRYTPQCVVTANTGAQLSNKTWRELAKWHRLSRNKHWFKWTATKFYHLDFPDLWYATAQPWSKDKPDAFAGTHEDHVLMLYDEASQIDDVIWEVTEGAMTTPGAMWVCFGNPTQNTGRFKECFGKFRHRWSTKQIDSRNCKMANKAQIDQWVEDYGDDHDFVRVRVKGQFPRASVLQFIGQDLVDQACKIDYKMDRQVWEWAPIVMGVDVAREGDDTTVIYIRQGLHTHLVKPLYSKNLMYTANIVAGYIKEWFPRQTFIDRVGIGAGVVDKLITMGHGPVVTGVNVGTKAIKEKEFFNKRAEIWAKMKNWLKAGGSIPDDCQQLHDDLIGPEYGFDNKDRLQLERKKDMKARGLASPDYGDALALTFSFPIAFDEKKPALSQAELDWARITGADTHSGEMAAFHAND